MSPLFLPVHLLVQFVMLPLSCSTTMSTLDCLSLARYLRKQNDLQMARKWLQLALEQYDQTPEVLHKLMQVDRLSILQELSEIPLNK